MLKLMISVELFKFFVKQECVKNRLIEDKIS